MPAKRASDYSVPALAILTAFAGLVVIACIIGAFFFELARGRSDEPFVWLSAMGGLSCLAAVVWLRWRG